MLRQRRFYVALKPTISSIFAKDVVNEKMLNHCDEQLNFELRIWLHTKGLFTPPFTAVINLILGEMVQLPKKSTLALVDIFGQLTISLRVINSYRI
jgi:hypothetical protein